MEITKSGNYLEGKTVALCICGGIAATEDIKLARMLRRYGADVTAYFTPAASKFVTETSMEWATGNKVVKELTGASEHLSLEDIVVIAPATCDTIGKIANGIADNAVTAKVLTALGRKTPVLFAPAMNMAMADSPFFCQNLGKLVEYAKMVDPRLDYGEGIAKMADTRVIAAEAARLASKSKLKGKKILITTGPTQGKIDAVRYISNRSSGKLGLEIAKDLYLRGADVKVVYGPGTEKPERYLDVKNVKTSAEMLESVLNEVRDNSYDAAIFAAAVLDFVPDKALDEKVKSGSAVDLRLVPAPKIITEVDKLGKHLFKVGFKLEYNKSKEELLDIAYGALLKNRCQLVIANDIKSIGSKSHPAMIITPERGVTEAATKQDIVEKLAEKLETRLNSTWLSTVYLDEKIEFHVEIFSRIGQRLDSMGLLPVYHGHTFGNYSARHKEGFLITGRNIDKKEPTPESTVYVKGIDFEKKEKYVAGTAKPSSEAVAHKMIYDAFPDANAIIHVHDDAVVRNASALGLPVTAMDYPCGTVESGRQALEALAKGSCVVLKEHGVLSIGKDIDDAFEKIKHYHEMAGRIENA